MVIVGDATPKSASARAKSSPITRFRYANSVSVNDGSSSRVICGGIEIETGVGLDVGVAVGVAINDSVGGGADVSDGVAPSVGGRFLLSVVAHAEDASTVALKASRASPNMDLVKDALQSMARTGRYFLSARACASTIVFAIKRACGYGFQPWGVL